MARASDTSPPIDPDDLTEPEETSTSLGLKAEQHAREKYGLEPDHEFWKDAAHQNGKPVSIKSCQPDRRYRVFEDPHDVLTSQQGYYVFVVYTPEHVGEGVADTEITVHAMKKMKATNVTQIIDGWNESGHDRGRQHKIPVKQVFSR